MSDLGNVRRIGALVVTHGKIVFSHKVRLLKPSNKLGYSQVTLVSDGTRIYKNIHTLVAESFLGYIQDKNFEVHHINYKRDDNCLKNLQVLSKEDHYAIHKLNYKPEHANEIETLYLEGYSGRTISEMTGVSKSSVLKYVKHLGISRKSRNKFYNKKQEERV